MAFDLRRLCNGGFTGRGTQVWTYRTDDAAATVATSGYFTNAWPRLKIGDYIMVSVVSGIDAASEALVDAVQLVVNGVSRTLITTADPSSSGQVILPNTATAAQINAEMAAVSAAGGGLVELAPGSFSLSAALNVPSNVTLRGSGRGITNLVMTATATPATVNSGFIEFAGVHDSSVLDLTLDISGVTAGGDGVTFGPNTSATSIPNDLTIAGTFTTGELITQATSLASAKVIYATSGHLVLYDIAGTFDTTNTVTGKASGTTGVPSVALANATAYKCSCKNVEVIGRAFTTNQYLIWTNKAMNILIENCLANGQSIIETATQFAFNTTTIDQNGIEILGGYNIRIINNVVRHCGRAGIQLGQPTAQNINNENAIITDNVIEGCSSGVDLSADFNTTGQKLKDVLFSRNTIKDCFRYGINIGITTANASELMSGVVIQGNLVDQRGAPHSATYGSYALRIACGTTSLCNGCKVIGNVFIGGGGGNAAALNILAPVYIVNTNSWEIVNNTFDSQIDTNCPQSVLLSGCTDTTFDGNTITNPGKLHFTNSASTGTIFTNNKIIGTGSISALSNINFTGSSHYCTIANNYVDSKAGANPTIFGDNTGNFMEVYGNVFANGTLGFYPTILPWADESGFATGATFTHGFGKFTPANATTVFTVICAKAKSSSRIRVQQVAAAGVAAQAVTVTQSTEGRFVLNGVFIGTSAWTYEISN